MGKLRFGMIGTGNISQWHGRQLLELDGEVELAALADPDEGGRERFIGKFSLGGITAYDDYRDMLEAEELDAVVICSPHTLHYRQASDAMKAGCHVLVEKPMTCSSREAEALLDVARETGKLLQVSYQRHFQPSFRYIRDAIRDGLIGRLTSVTASLYQDWRQLTVGTWRVDPRLSGGGMLMDSGSHIADVLLWTTGLTPAEVKPVMHRQGSPVEIDSFTAIRFEEGPVAGLNIVGHAPCWHETYVFCGEEGGLFYDNGRITVRKPGEDPFVPELPEATTNQAKSFVDAIRGRQDVAVPGEFALRVVRLTEMIYEAAGCEPLREAEGERAE
ncbi:Gfo/Idh/MocA family protein [Paenibacillus flagellatus]|uniref:Gfo/Idh/MocA family oxidoreductase n=1 Tax=Paenibacillus flagellatus TaxID=2211139 RepID=A0A2V5JW76_9BACL|nr:Gfo/Idh/MocA family oxidoreductase [Paenibacillus flagellatus]PYI51035.1 gfo/Idh/MocA family oxidoreductase [Paenibacillus flagellatus]